MKSAKSLLALTFILASAYSLGAQVQSEQTEYDYRIVKKEWPDGHWTTGVHKVFYYPNTNKEMIFDLSDYPVTVTGESKREVKRELQLFVKACDRPMLVFPMVGPTGSQ